MSHLLGLLRGIFFFTLFLESLFAGPRAAQRDFKPVVNALTKNLNKLYGFGHEVKIHKITQNSQSLFYSVYFEITSPKGERSIIVHSTYEITPSFRSSDLKANDLVIRKYLSALRTYAFLKPLIPEAPEAFFQGGHILGNIRVILEEMIEKNLKVLEEYNTPKHFPGKTLQALRNEKERYLRSILTQLKSVPEGVEVFGKTVTQEVSLESVFQNPLGIEKVFQDLARPLLEIEKTQQGLRHFLFDQLTLKMADDIAEFLENQKERLLKEPPHSETEIKNFLEWQRNSLVKLGLSANDIQAAQVHIQKSFPEIYRSVHNKTNLLKGTSLDMISGLWSQNPLDRIRILPLLATSQKEILMEIQTTQLKELERVLDNGLNSLEFLSERLEGRNPFLRLLKRGKIKWKTKLVLQAKEYLAQLLKIDTLIKEGGLRDLSLQRTEKHYLLQQNALLRALVQVSSKVEEELEKNHNKNIEHLLRLLKSLGIFATDVLKGGDKFLSISCAQTLGILGEFASLHLDSQFPGKTQEALTELKERIDFILEQKKIVLREVYSLNQGPDQLNRLKQTLETDLKVLKEIQQRILGHRNHITERPTLRLAK